MTAALYIIFFVSGAASLAFEILWFHQAALAFGSSVWASSLVLSGFMAGLAVGNAFAARRGARLRSPLRAYAACEAAIAVAGVALVYGLPWVGSAFATHFTALLAAPLALNALRFASAFALLLIPSSAMGATLPLLAQTLTRAEERFGRVLGTLYGWNTLGAVCGALAAEAIGIAALGIRGTALAAAAGNALAALAALAIAQRAGSGGAVPAAAPESAALQDPAGDSAPVRADAGLLAAAFLSGFALLALEEVWFRLLSLFVMEYALSLAVMLAVVLSGIALGGLLAAGWLRLAPRADRAAAAVVWLAGAACVASYALSPRFLAPRSAELIEQPLAILRIGAPLMLPTSLLSGVVFTLLGSALRRRRGSDAAASGALTLANTAGAAAGALAAGFVLLPRLGMERALFALALVYVAAGLCAFLAAPRARSLAAGAIALAAALLFPFGTMGRAHLPVALARWMHTGAYRPLLVREGLTSTVAYMEQLALDGRHISTILLTNGYSMSGTGTRNRRYMQLFVYGPVALRPAPRDALLISYGVGATARALVQTRSLERIDVVDVSREILDGSAVVYPDPAQNPLRDPRVAVHVEDGRYFLQTTSRRFDLITGEPPPPPLAGVSNLYTREYFALMRERLREGGVVSYWLPLHSLSTAASQSVVRAFCDVFPDCSLWHGNQLDLVLIGSRGLRGPVAQADLEAQWRDAVAGPELRALGFERPEQLGALFLADADQLAEWTRGAEPVTDDFPRRLLAPWRVLHGAAREHAAWFDADAARARFESSRFVAALWPEALRTASLPYFAVQGATDRNAFEGFSLDHDAPMLDTLLRTTDLHAPVLWLLESDADIQRALREAAPAALQHAFSQLQLGAGALAERRYADAAQHYAQAEAVGDHDERRDAFRLRIFALCLAGEQGEAARLARQGFAAHRPRALAPFWSWLRERYGVDASAGTDGQLAGDRAPQAHPRPSAPAANRATSAGHG